MPTEVIEPGKERWLGVFLHFDRNLWDPRTDGNSQIVYFRRDESFKVVVKMGPEDEEGRAERVDLEPDALMVCDVRLRHGQKQIVSTDLELARRQVFLYAAADSIRVLTAHSYVSCQPQRKILLHFLFSRCKTCREKQEFKER